MSILYTDGGVLGRNPSEIGGTWAWVLVSENDKTMILCDSGMVAAGTEPVTNNQMEFYAIARGLYDNADFSITEVKSDSKISLGRFFMGWSITNIPEWMMEIYYKIMRSYPCKPWTKILKMKYTLLDGHPTKEQLASGVGKRGHMVSYWNVLCDQMCNDEKEKYYERVTIS